MSCGSCGVACGASGKPNGCQSNGGCDSGGCNKLNSFDWLSPAGWEENSQFYEISFKKGARKEFYKNDRNLDLASGEMVVVETQSGKDVGQISLGGPLVALQMKKHKAKANELDNILRLATEKDIDQLGELRSKEGEAMIKARVTVRRLKLNMKIGDVEFQGDGRKMTFFYTAEERVDFRELIKEFAKEYHVKIEMRQIGARQESARIGGIGDCGRELCCSTWLTDFKSVSTGAARYQNLAINQAKLSGQCGRLKCCLNFELDTYIDALKDFPKKADKIETEAGTAYLQKTDIFKRKMIYTYKKSTKFYELEVERVKELIEMNKEGKKPVELSEFVTEVVEVKEIAFEDAVGQVTLKSLEKTSRRRKNKNQNNKGRGNNKGHQAKSNESGANANGPKKKTDSRPKKKNQQRKKGPNNGPKRNTNSGPKNKSDNRPNKRKDNPNE